MQQEDQEVQHPSAGPRHRLLRIVGRGWYPVVAFYFVVLFFLIALPGHPYAWTMFALANLVMGAYILFAIGLSIALNPQALRRRPRLPLVNVAGAVVVAAILAYDSLSHLLPTGSLPHIVDLVPSPVIALWNGIDSFLFIVALAILLFAYGLRELRRSERRSTPARRP